jgi:assimilatory nitrate reductase catalytic subunit
VADNIKKVQAKYGRDSVAIISTGQMLTEEFYTLGK